MKPWQLFLGILTALGGFVDIGELVFASQAGAKFGHQILWPIILGTIGIIIYAEMCGRVAAIAKRPVFEMIRETTGFEVGLITLIASQIVNVMTCAAEVGGVAIVLQLLGGLPYRAMLIAAVVLLVLSVWMLPFQWIEKIYGLGGLLMLVFVAAALSMGPDWGHVGTGLLPNPPDRDWLVYAYFVVGLLGATLMPYEVFFYSSGGIEKQWGTKEQTLNRFNACVRFAIGSLVSLSLVVIAAQLFLPRGISPELLGTAALGPISSYGKIGLVVALLGIFFAVGGAAVETALAGAYNFSQFFGWEWGRYRTPKGAPRFTISYLVIFTLALAIVMLGLDPVKLTEYAVIFSVVALPLTYFPILLVAGNENYMGEYKNTRISNVLGWSFFVLILVVALAAVPLTLLSHGGRG